MVTSFSRLLARLASSLFIKRLFRLFKAVSFLYITLFLTLAGSAIYPLDLPWIEKFKSHGFGDVDDVHLEKDRVISNYLRLRAVRKGLTQSSKR